MEQDNGERAFGAQVTSASTERDLAAAFMDHAGDLLQSPRVGFYLLDGARAAEIHTRGVKAAFVDDYESFARAGDPVFAEVIRSRLPRRATFATLMRRGSEGYREFVQEWRCTAYLLMPIVVGGEVVGTMNMARGTTSAASAFTASEARRALRISMDVSNRVAALRALAARSWSRWEGVLSDRQLEVAEAATRGFSVAEMGRALGVSPNTVKKHLKSVYALLGVSTRAELALALVAGPAPANGSSFDPRVPHTFRTCAGSPAFAW